ncbi:unnamed protein product [Paramecium primaurelia]|uniref:Transmembrane protein n=1 Tax=Paramecium primaurelia TaxID=5886 RepID=A0A8S1JSH4_PARPR|nr:unnamed protein product [Paramecium primaurelia]CAD8044560.1 unnamed protein product [Paramecium primaurelia]
MNNILKHKLFTSPDYSYQKQKEEDEIANPMVDSFFSQKSQITLKSNSSPQKNIKLILKSDKKLQFIKPQNYQLKREGLDIKQKKQKKYQQLDYLIPSIKLVQVKEKQIEYCNGEEVTIDQKIYFNNNNQIRNIYQMTQIGYKLEIEEEEDQQKILMENSIPISEKMIKSLRAKKQFQKVKNKISNIKQVFEISKDLPDEIKRQKKDRENSNHINQLLNDPNVNVKSEHQLGELIGKTKVVTTYKNLENNQTFQQPKDIVMKKEKVNMFLTKTLIIHTFCTLGVLLLIFILAYAKTINGYQFQDQDQDL